MSPRFILLAIVACLLAVATLFARRDYGHLTSKRPTAESGFNSRDSSSSERFERKRLFGRKHVAILAAVTFAVILTASVLVGTTPAHESRKVTARMEPVAAERTAPAAAFEAVLNRIGAPSENMGDLTEALAEDLAGIQAVAASATATTKTYYLDSVNGSDSKTGTSPTAAWRSVSRATQATFQPGDRLLLRRGTTFNGSLGISESGSSSASIYISGYGAGTKPVVTGGSSCVKVSGSYVVVNGLEMRDCSWAGMEFSDGARFSTVVGSAMSRSIVGVYFAGGAANNRVIANQIKDNTKMSRLTPEPNDDNGAFGVLLNGDPTKSRTIRSRATTPSRMITAETALRSRYTAGSPTTSTTTLPSTTMPSANSATPGRAVTSTDTTSSGLR